MKEIGIEGIKQISLNILCEIHLFCKKNNIKYFLVAGTLLGAVRHKGFIPWDDDIDIGMLREDYEKFIQLFPNSHQYLKLFSPETHPNFYAPFAVVSDQRTVLNESSINFQVSELGVKVDIFPYDGINDDLEEYMKEKRWLLKYNRLQKSKYYNLSTLWKKNFKFWIKLLFIRLYTVWIPYSKMQQKVKQKATKYRKIKTRNVDCIVFDLNRASRVPRQCLTILSEIEFEHHRFPAPNDVDLFLTAAFGNYMILPPESERVPHHGFTAYWKDGFENTYTTKD